MTKIIFQILIILFFSRAAFSQDGKHMNYYTQCSWKSSISDLQIKGMCLISIDHEINDDDHSFNYLQINKEERVQGILTPPFSAIKLSKRTYDYSASKFQKSGTKNFPSIFITDSSECRIIALGIHPSNAKQYKYRIIENDEREIEPWTSSFQFEKPEGLENRFAEPYAVIGTFNKPGKSLFIEIQNVENYSIRDGYFIQWGEFVKPKLIQIVGNNKGRLSNLIKDKNQNSLHETKSNVIDKDGDYNIIVDSVQYLTFYFEPHLFVPYRIFIVRKSDKGDEDVLEIKDFYGDEFAIFQEQFDKPGEYTITISTPKTTENIVGKDGKAEFKTHKEERVTIIKFNKKPESPPKETTYSFKQIFPYAAATLTVAALLFYGYYRSNKSKLKKAGREKEMKQVQLRSLRNQLNPHFLFNSLSAIQNLINRNDIKSANHYLSQFAGLTRTVLDTSEEELISLEDELKMLHAYLQMEQLRFPFQYSITVDEQINKANTEIPAMLIQPFAENAVKHGVASLKEEGLISIFIQSINKSLAITIQDNGRGFNAGQPVNGNGSMGLKLSRERIRLLNEMYGADSIELKIDADTTGTMININLKDWLS